MTIIVHISDTHFGTEVLPVLDALKQSMEALQPDIVILSGDITQRARTLQFKAAADFMASLPAKTKLVVPGNHDIPLFNIFARFLTPYGHYQKAFGAREYSWHGEDIGIVCYDATSRFRHTRGQLTPRAVLSQINIIKKHLNPGAILIACAHQPLVTAWPQDANETLINRDETARLWSENHIDIVLSGHVHVPLLTTTHKAFPNLSRHFILAGAGTAISHRIRPGAPNSFNVITCLSKENTPSIFVSHYSFETETSRFIAMHPVHFMRTEQGWHEASTIA